MAEVTQQKLNFNYQSIYKNLSIFYLQTFSFSIIFYIHFENDLRSHKNCCSLLIFSYFRFDQNGISK